MELDQERQCLFQVTKFKDANVISPSRSVVFQVFSKVIPHTSDKCNTNVTSQESNPTPEPTTFWICWRGGLLVCTWALVSELNNIVCTAWVDGSTLVSHKQWPQGTRMHPVVFSPSCGTQGLCWCGLFIYPVLMVPKCQTHLIIILGLRDPLKTLVM